MKYARRTALALSLALALSPGLVACNSQGTAAAGGSSAQQATTAGSAASSAGSAADAGSSAEAGSSAGSAAQAGSSAAPSPTAEPAVAQITYDVSRNIIDTPYYAVVLPSSWTGHYKAWDEGAELVTRDDGTGLGCTVHIARVDSDDPTAAPTQEDYASGVYGITVFNENYDVQGEFSAIPLGDVIAAPGWHVTVYGPWGQDEAVAELADCVSLK